MSQQDKHNNFNFKMPSCAGRGKQGGWWTVLDTQRFPELWEILGCVKQADWASFHLLFWIIFTPLEFPCCAKCCPAVSLLPRSHLFAWGNWGRVILTCKRRRHMLHANERASAKSRQIFPPCLPQALLLLPKRISRGSGWTLSHQGL